MFFIEKHEFLKLIRNYPNGPIQCVVNNKQAIWIYGYNSGWYETDYCGFGHMGYIHESQVTDF